MRYDAEPRLGANGKPIPKGLTPWKKGQSGNPGGRPKKVSNALDQALTKTELQAIAKGVLKAAKAGSTNAFIAIRETIEGKLPQAVTGADGGPLQIAIVDLGSDTG